MPGDHHHAPHLEPASWGRLVDSLDVANIFVVIQNWLGDRLRAEVSVEDIWQETLWLAWRDRGQHEWRNLTAYRAWLLGIARNRVLDLGRKLSRQKRGGADRTARFSDLAENTQLAGYLPPQSTTPSRTASHLERSRLLQCALDTLDEPLRDMVRLRLFEELSVQDAATALAIPVSTAKERLLRGTRKYRDALRRLFGRDDTTTGSPP